MRQYMCMHFVQGCDACMQVDLNKSGTLDASELELALRVSGCSQTYRHLELLQFRVQSLQSCQRPLR